MERSKKVELLSPAKDAFIAKNAILAGCDAIYMGAPKFSARFSAANELSDLESVAKFAHTYGVKLYIALNTILDDRELLEAQKLAFKLYEIGADALIIQDLGLLNCELPPMQIHASTQCDIRTKEKAKFLEACGFSTLVLARELTLGEIREIAESVECNIECFAHGALCVSYSGQCYLSAAIGGRSGNRGQCAQPCRMKYELRDSNFKEVSPAAHFLSLKDFNASDIIGDMLDAGVRSFKIEGRLKDCAYVKNITAFYRKILDEKIAEKNLERASLGACEYGFVPALEKSFNRGFTEYFLRGKSPKNIASFDTPKSKGEYLGLAQNSISGGFEMERTDISNGDGLLIKNPSGEIFGTLVQKTVAGKIICGRDCPKIQKLAQIWRNKNQKFEKQISASNTSRKIDISIRAVEENDSYIFKFTEPQTRLNACFALNKSECEPAKNAEASTCAIKSNIAKLGKSEFRASSIEIDFKNPPFLQAGKINEIRRTLCERLQSALESHFLNLRTAKTPRKIFELEKNIIEAIPTDYRANAMNNCAKSFYEKMGINIEESAFECGETNVKERELMRTRHCILRELGMCKKQGKFPKNLKEPLFLKNEEATLKLKFYCEENCGMGLSKCD